MKFKEYFNFLLVMTEKELKARYKNALLGFLWIFLNPLLQMLVIGFVFQHIVRFDVANYYLFLFPGLLFWNFFSYTLNKTTPSIVFERNLIQKAKFPRESIPLSIVFANFFNFSISLFLLIFYLIISGNIQLNNLGIQQFINFIFSITWLLSFTLGLSLLTSALNVKFRDISFIIQALVILWFYATPIIYPTNFIPEKISFIFQINPLTYPLELLRSSLINTALPSLEILRTNIFISSIIIVLGIIIFKKESKKFSDWL